MMYKISYVDNDDAAVAAVDDNSIYTNYLIHNIHQ